MVRDITRSRATVLREVMAFVMSGGGYDEEYRCGGYNYNDSDEDWDTSEWSIVRTLMTKKSGPR